MPSISSSNGTEYSVRIRRYKCVNDVKVGDIRRKVGDIQ